MIFLNMIIFILIIFVGFLYILWILVNDIMCFGCLIVVVKDLFLRGELIKII